MSTVTIATEDLRALIFAAKLSTQIDNMISVWRRDPFVKAETKNLAPIMDRVERQWREAERAELFPAWNEPLSEKDIQLLLELCEYPTPGATKATQKGIWDGLCKRGMAEIGVPAHGTIWSGQESPEWVFSNDIVMVRPTQRGLKTAADLNAKPAAESAANA